MWHCLQSGGTCLFTNMSLKEKSDVGSSIRPNSLLGVTMQQGLSVLVERKMAAGYRRIFAWAVVAGPVFWLFHPLFVKRVVIPMMETMRAL